MKLNKVKKIIIKDPRLRDLRYNMRKILKLEIDRKRGRILGLIHLYVLKGMLTPTQQKSKRILKQLERELDRARKQSIVYTPHIDRDMVWDPEIGWRCMECYYEYLKDADYRKIYMN